MDTDLLRSEVEAGVPAATGNEQPCDGTVTYLMFGLGSRHYAIDVTCVREIVDLTEIQQIPNAPHDVLGMIDLRSQSIPVIDLASRMQVTANPQADARIIVFEFAQSGRNCLIGVVADRVLGVREVGSDVIESLENAVAGWPGDGIVGVIRNDGAQSLVLRIEHFLQVENLPGEFEFE